MTLLTQDEVDQALADELTEWTRAGDAISRAVTADTFPAGIRLVSAVAEAAEDMGHHPDIDIRWTTVTFTLSTHSEGGLTENDLRLARDIDRLTQAG